MLNNYKKLKFDDKSGRFLEENGNSKDNTVNI